MSTETEVHPPIIPENGETDLDIKEPEDDQRDKDQQENKNEAHSDEELEESEEEEEEEDDDFEIVLKKDNMNLTNVGDKSDMIKQRLKYATQSGQSLQPVQTTAPNTTNQMLSILTLDKFNTMKIPDVDASEDKPWTKPGADISDYFNYGLTEDTWRLYLHKQSQMRQEFPSQNKIKVLQTSSKEDKEVDRKDEKRDRSDHVDKSEKERYDREMMDRERLERERYDRERMDYERRKEAPPERYRYRERYDRERYDRERTDYDRGREDYDYNRGGRHQSNRKRSRSRDEYKVEDSWESDRKRRR